MNRIEKTKIFLLVTAIFISCTACNGSKKEIKKNAKIFIEAYYRENYEDTRSVSTYTTQKLVDKKAYYSSLNPSFSKKNIKSEIEGIVLLQSKDKAIVKYNVNSGTRTLYMSKSDKGWLVDMDEKHPIELFLGPQSQPSEKDAGMASSESEPISLGDVE